MLVTLMQIMDMEYRVVSYFPSETDEGGAAFAAFVRLETRMYAYVLEDWAETVGCLNEFSVEWFDELLNSFDLRTDSAKDALEDFFINAEFLSMGPLRTTESGSVSAYEFKLHDVGQHRFLIKCDKQTFASLVNNILKSKAA